MNYKNENNIADLIKRESLQKSGNTFRNLYDAFNYIMPRDEAQKIIRPCIIGIDGPVTAGKTCSAYALKDVVEKTGRSFHTIHCDWFMSSRSTRAREIIEAQKPGYSFEDYRYLACDFHRIKELVLSLRQFLLNNGGGHDFTYTVRPAYSRETGECNGIIHGVVAADSVILVEGGGLLNEELFILFDLAIRLDVSSTEEVLKRLRDREKQKTDRSLDLSFMTERYFLLDLPFDNYLRIHDSPYFDILIDTTKMNDIKLFKRSGK